jgi:hypothetical protein
MNHDGHMDGACGRGCPAYTDLVELVSDLIEAGPLLGTLETPVADLQPATKETPNG